MHQCRKCNSGRIKYVKISKYRKISGFNERVTLSSLRSWFEANLRNAERDPGSQSFIGRRSERREEKWTEVFIRQGYLLKIHLEGTMICFWGSKTEQSNCKFYLLSVLVHSMIIHNICPCIVWTVEWGVCCSVSGPGPALQCPVQTAAGPGPTANTGHQRSNKCSCTNMFWRKNSFH